MWRALGKLATNCMRLWCSDTIGMCVQTCRVASGEPHTARTITERGVPADIAARWVSRPPASTVLISTIR